MADSMRGQWIVCVRDILSGNDDYLGPYHSEDKADEVAKRLNLNIAAVGASEVLDAIVEWVRPGLDIEQYRDDMLRELAETGYRQWVEDTVLIDGPG